MAGTGGDKLPAAKCNQVQQEQIWYAFVYSSIELDLSSLLSGKITYTMKMWQPKDG
jgi:hypothetical protein